MPNLKRRRGFACVLLAAVSAAALAACSQAPGGASRATTAAITKGCDADYCAPASWDTGPSPSPFPQIKSFREPVNVVLSAQSTVSLSALQKALAHWKNVSAATKVSVSGIHMMCISTEQADVTGSRYAPMQQAWRLDGCLHGNELSVSGKEGHVRMWHQPVPGSRGGAWFIAASYETMCVVRDGRLQPVKSNKLYAVLHSSESYHCVNGGPGSITSHYANGYDDGASAFVADITQAAKAQGWHVGQQTLTVQRNAHAGEGGVPFSDDVDLLTVTS
ncbi:MAG: hypothetical protein FWE35_12450 [Streptosporangiales bacterium]|nr:hypothetical protein [Streptosporangiales bacterium]